MSAKPVRRGDDHPLSRPVQFVRGVGPYRARILADMGLHTLGDLIEHFPFRYEEQLPPQRIDSLLLNEPATVIGVVEQLRWRGGPGQATANIILRDGSGTARVTWFNAEYLRDKLERGQLLRVHGTVGEFESLAQFANPRVEWLDADADPKSWHYARLLPVYAGTGELPSVQMAKLVTAALAEGLPAVVDPLPEELRTRLTFAGRAEAIRDMHQPKAVAECQRGGKTWRRLAFEELFMSQLAVALTRRWASNRGQAPRLPVTAEIDRRIRARFPFPLTRAQDRVIREIAADMALDKPMSRLLQGDVGSGKTVVALYAALTAVANRRQCAILAPTEVLATQHFASMEKYLSGSRVHRCLLTGSTAKPERDKALRALADGSMNLVVGTQALLESRVKFRSLGLVIVDEQHKFGVSQRATLRGKSGDAAPAVRGKRGAPAPAPIPHYLVMTATPIPRTLSMTVFGDLDVSVVDELPPGRQPIETRLVRGEDEASAWLDVRRRIAAGDQAYIVYPLVEESDALDLKSATQEVGRVASDLLPGARAGLLHGRMKKDEKARVMAAFARHEIDVLVCTTVIEVGVDVPNATVMVVQHAERYGLSALHQLRGRVGRGRKPSLCLLISDSRGENAWQRLSALCATTDGFRIAETDLRLRGPGELLGTRQHGATEFKLASLVEDLDLLMSARDEAARIVSADPSLSRPDHTALKAELRRRYREKVAFIDVG